MRPPSTETKALCKCVKSLLTFCSSTYYYCISLCLIELNLFARESLCVKHTFSCVASIFIL